MVWNGILHPLTLGHRFTDEHGLMDGLSFRDTPIDSCRAGEGWNLYGARIFFQKSPDKLMERKSGLEVGIFFPKIP